MSFNYDRAFERNLGLVSEDEQRRLQRARVALPGLGGVGGAHLQALARMGVGAFNLADPDTFDTANLNRQLGATQDTLGQSKVEVLAEMARGINPDADVRTFQAVNPGNMAEFLRDVDIVVDGLEFFTIAVRRELYRECRRRGIPVINAGPIGYGAAILVFTPQGASFDDYFGIDDSMTRAEQLIAFGLGLAPGLGGDIDPARVNINEQKGPALCSACLLCAAAAATEALKLLCGRGATALAPNGIYYDPYRCRTFRLRPRPPLTRSLRGRLLRWLSFRRFPAFQAMHDRELAARRCAAPVMN